MADLKSPSIGRKVNRLVIGRELDSPQIRGSGQIGFRRRRRRRRRKESRDVPGFVIVVVVVVVVVISELRDRK